MKVIVGLGNPGSEYCLTRHNLGFMVVERLAQEFNCSFKRDTMVSGMVAQAQTPEDKVMLVMPLTFMNRSGICLQQIMRTRNIPLDNLLVITDDFNLVFGQLRMRVQGSDGGHNGLKSITQHLGSNAFPRLRMGIGQPKINTEKYVLGQFSKDEQEKLNAFIDQAVGCCHTWLTDGAHKAMDQYN